jgi:dTDP-glucose pyrophosphorylase
MSTFRDIEISKSTTLIHALKQMDAIDKKLLIIMEGRTFQGILSAGDIQRAIIQNKPLETIAGNIVRKNIKIARPGDSFDYIKKMMIDYRMEFCPVINQENEVLSIHYWEEIFEKKKIDPHHILRVPVVIMAGGFGTRLKPLTNVLPKPLIPLGDKTMLEEILERFSFYGSDEFYISINYKADLIRFYMDSLQLPYAMNYIKEEAPSGTAGSLSMLKGKINETFFVNNCDIIIDQDYTEIYDYHKAHNNEITIVAALKHYSIPYGTVKSTDGGELIEIQEKPDLNFWINTGMYILEPEVLNDIPENVFFHITDLINQLKLQGRKIGVFPVSEGSWLDTGEWDQYKKTQEKLYGQSF